MINYKNDNPYKIVRGYLESKLFARYKNLLMVCIQKQYTTLFIKTL